MSVSKTILLISLSFALPIAVLVYFTVTNIDANITFAQRELKGDEYQRPLEDLLHHLQAAQIALHTTGEVMPVETAMMINTDFLRLQQVDRRLESDLQFTDQGLAQRSRGHERVAMVQAEWTELAREIDKIGDTTIPRLLADPVDNASLAGLSRLSWAGCNSLERLRGPHLRRK